MGFSPVKLHVRAFLHVLGKSERRVAGVFGVTSAGCHAAVVYLRRGAPELPVWLFSTSEPSPDTLELCEQVHIHRSALLLFLMAQRLLWRRWVAISIGTWTGERGHWLLKLAPFLIPPFRALLLNGHGDFFPGAPVPVLVHCRRLVWDCVHPAGNRGRDIARACWMLISYHIWRSGPFRRTRDIAQGCWMLITCHLWRSGPCTRVKDVSRGLALLFSSMLRHWCSYPGRTLFRRLHGSKPLPMALVAPGDADLGCFPHDGLNWDGRKLEKFARSSTARWILWGAPASDDLLHDMLPLFEDQRTFAVARQTHFRAWKTMLFPMAPFRTLQEGEATQVLAPISATILVDGQKLLALGVPRYGRAGTAWLMLFWKAAAAGWRCYCVGQAGNVRQQLDSPIQEAAFLSRILVGQGLRCLGPREPGLSRGTIAFTPSRARSGTPRNLKVLVVSPFLPYPLSHGGAVRIYNLCRALRGRVDFVLAAFRETNDVTDYARLHEVFPQVYVVDIDEPASKDESLPAQVREHQSRSMRALIAELCRTEKPDLLQVEYTHMAGFRTSAPDIPAVLVEHDLTFTLYRQLAEKNQAARREYELWLRYERHWLSAFDAVWTVSEEDRLAAMREGSRRTFAVANGVDTARFVPGEEPQSAAREILYVGSFRHLPNILGFEKLRREVMPRVWKLFPELRLRVVAGPEYERFWREFLPAERKKGFDPRIGIHGFVADLRPLYAQASVVVAPLEVSAGTNIKVLEAMACGKALVTTPVGCAGLGLRDGYDAAIRADWAEFADSICELLSNRVLRRRIAAQARRTGERFSWMTIAEAACQSYEATVVRPDAAAAVGAS